MSSKSKIIILGIESSCDDTSAAIVKDGILYSNFIANQQIHSDYGGVVPELASRAHQQNIVPVIDKALKSSETDINDISAIAFTQGPGLLGSLLVGTSFAKSMSLGLNIPIIGINHIEAHISALFISENGKPNNHPEFPFLCLTVSGGHTQISLVESHHKIKIIGKTIDDAAGEAFDKTAKILGLPYPGGPVIDKLSKLGNPDRFKFSKPNIDNYDYSFSGLKTSILYFLQKEMQKDSSFIKNNINDICASVQLTIVDILLEKLEKASKNLNIKNIAIAGGVSANSCLKNELINLGNKNNWKTYIPELRFTTDNAAMIAINGYYRFLNGESTPLTCVPYSRITV